MASAPGWLSQAISHATLAITNHHNRTEASVAHLDHFGHPADIDDLFNQIFLYTIFARLDSAKRYPHSTNIKNLISSSNTPKTVKIQTGSRHLPTRNGYDHDRDYRRDQNHLLNPRPWLFLPPYGPLCLLTLALDAGTKSLLRGTGQQGYAPGIVNNLHIDVTIAAVDTHAWPFSRSRTLVRTRSALLLAVTVGFVLAMISTKLHKIISDTTGLADLPGDIFTRIPDSSPLYGSGLRTIWTGAAVRPINSCQYPVG